MSTTPTTNFGWLKPDDGTEDDAWGPLLNTIFDEIDSELFAVTPGNQVVPVTDLGSGTVDPTVTYDMSVNKMAQVAVDLAGTPAVTIEISGGDELTDDTGMQATLIVRFTGSQVIQFGATARITKDASFAQMIWSRRSVSGAITVGNGPMDTFAHNGGHAFIRLTAWELPSGVKMLHVSLDEWTAA